MKFILPLLCLSHLRFLPLPSLLLAGFEVIAFDRQIRFFFVLLSPGAQAVTVPGHARLERRQLELFPDLFGELRIDEIDHYI